MRNPNRVAAKRRREAAGEDMSNPYDAIVIYNSANKSTMEYAKWISDELNTDLVPYSRKHLAYASLYRNVIYIGWIRAGEITRLMMLRQNESNFDLRSKNVVICGVGIGPVDDERYVQDIADANGLDSVYLLPGRYNPKKVSGTAAASVKAMKDSMFAHYTEDVAELMRERFDKGYDGVDKKYIDPIIANIKATAQE
ncbi:MAG: flavodoxin domain-containing protein [Firmicutes bacterium]|nr:flavodoxin domain-containing protein [Bacillota bacterium]